MDLFGDQLSQQLELADYLNARQEGCNHLGLDEAGQGDILLQDVQGQALVVPIHLLVHGSDTAHKRLLLWGSSAHLDLGRDGATTNIDAVVAVKSSQLTHQPVDDEFVKTLKELSAEVLVKEVDEPETKCLLSLRTVPVTQLVQVDALIHRVEHGCEEPTHKCEVVFVNRFKLRDKLCFIRVDVSHVLLVHQLGRLLVYSKRDDPLELFAPYFLTLDIQEVLDELNRAL